MNLRLVTDDSQGFETPNMAPLQTDLDRPNILISRLSAIGDCILTIPLAVEIKRIWPHCKITWAVDCAAASLLEPHGSIDEVLRIEKRWLKQPRRWKTLKQSLRERQFDYVFDPQGLTKSAALGWLSGAKKRIGMDYSHAREIAPLLASKRIRRTHRHMVDTYRELVSPWTQVTPGEGCFKMPQYSVAAEVAEQFVCQSKLRTSEDGGFVTLNPGAGWPTKVWPVQRFAQVARELREQYGYRSLITWAGESELLMARVIEENSRGAAVVAPKTNLCELAELLRRSAMLLSSDTGPLHLAAAMGTRCVGLYGVTWADECGPYGDGHISIQSPILPAPKKTVRSGPNTSMRAIEVDDVVRDCGQILSSRAHPLRLCA